MMFILREELLALNIMKNERDSIEQQQVTIVSSEKC